MNPLNLVRSRLSDGLFQMVAGDDGPAARERIHTTPGERWFPAGSPIHRVHGDASMYVGGIRALLLQSLHPLAMAGVDDFSDFRTDVWGRLARTSTFLADTTFGTAEHAERAVRIVRAVHKRIVGTAPDGRPYAASDPHLLTWVHVAEVDSFLTAHQAFGAHPLTVASATRTSSRRRSSRRSSGRATSRRLAPLSLRASRRSAPSSSRLPQRSTWGSSSCATRPCHGWPSRPTRSCAAGPSRRCPAGRASRSTSPTRRAWTGPSGGQQDR